MTTTSCYSLGQNTNMPGQVSILSSMNSINSSIYESSTVSFVNDTQAYTTVDINQSKITKVSWCTQSSFTVNIPTQSNLVFNLPQGVSDQYFPITPFSATLNCGTFTNTWKYTGVDNSDGHPLVAANDLMSIDSSTGSIFVSKSKPLGTYIIKVIGTLPDLLTTTSAVFTINVKTNTIPIFSSTLNNVSVPLMGSQTYLFPSITDPDYGATTSLSEVKDTATGILPTFITLTSTSLIINPKQMSQVKAYTMIAIITDTKDTNEYSFVLTVTNLPPCTTTTFITPFAIDFGVTTIYGLPNSKDPEGLPYTTAINSGPSYIQLNSSSNELIIQPTNCATDLGTATVKIDLTDEYPSVASYSIVFQVKNQAPQFSGNPPIQNQIVMTNSIVDYTISSCSDPEGCPLLYSTTPAYPFVSIIGNQIKFSPDQTQNGTYAITISCTDNQGISTNTAFDLIVYQPPKFQGNVIQKINLIASNPANYSLPIFPGISDEHINHSSSLPRYINFSFPSYSFFPDRVSDLGIKTIQGQLCNTYSCINFRFNLNVTNYPPYLNGTLQNIIMSRNTQISYFIPEVIDREGQMITVEAHDIIKTELPPFVKFSSITKEFNFSPTQLDLSSIYWIRLKLTDTFGASSIQTLSVTLYDQPSIKQIKKSGNTSSSQNNATIAAYLSILKNQSEIISQILTIEIVKITRDQKASIKIKNASIQKSIIPEILVQFSNKSFEILVMQSNVSYSIEFYNIERDLANSIINLNLKYPRPSNLSLNSPDQLKVRTLQRIQKLKKQVLTIVPENIESVANIPPQISTDLKGTIEQYIQGGRIAFTENTPTNMAIGFFIQIVWIQLEDISFLATNSMLAITIPGIPQIIQAVMIKYIYFDILYTEFWLSQFMQKIGIEVDLVNNDQALNLQFSENGFDSKQFLKNSGSSVFFLAFYIISWLIFLIVAAFSLCSTKMKTLKENIQRQLIWKFSLNLLISQFPPLFLCSLLNFYDLRFKRDENLTEYSAYLSIIFTVSSLILLVLLFLKVGWLTRKLNQASVQEFQTTYSTLISSLKETFLQKLIYFWKPLYLLRWGITLTILITVQDKPSFQIQGLLILSVIWQSLILTSQPFTSKALNIISFYNEVAVSVYLYVAFLFTDYLETQIYDNDTLNDTLRLTFAWILTSLLIFTIFINLMFTLANIVGYIFKYLKNKLRCCQKKAAKHDNQRELRTNEYQIQTNQSQDCAQVSKSTEVTKFVNQSFEDVNGQKIIEKSTKSTKKSLQIKNGQQEFYDMFEMRP